MDEQGTQQGSTLSTVTLQVPEALSRAFQRCLWIRVHETGQTPLAVMEEVILDFLIKHGC